jgi:hypothetical protein
MLAMVPPAQWSLEFERTPSELLLAATRGHWSELLVGAWAAACERHRDEDWAEALLKARTQANAKRLMRLVEILSPRRREALLWTEMQARTEAIRPMHEGPLALLRYCRHAWSAGFTRYVLSSLRAEERGNRDAFSVISSLVAQLARHMDPTVAHDPAIVGPDLQVNNQTSNASRWTELCDAFLPILHFRLELRAAFAPAQVATIAPPETPET